MTFSEYAAEEVLATVRSNCDPRLDTITRG